MTLAALFLVTHAAIAAQSADSPGPEEHQLVQRAFGGQLAKAQVLVEKGAAVDAVGGKKRTALIWAAANGHTAVVEYLHIKGADINAKDSDSQIAPMLAVRRSHVPTVEFLLESGAEVNVQSLERQISALMNSAAVGNETIVRMLLDRGAGKSLVGLGRHAALDRAPAIRPSIRSGPA